MIDYLIEPLNYDYMKNALIISAMIGAASAFLSCYLILKGWSLMGDALAHSIVPGVAIAYYLNAPFSLGAFISGLLASWSMNYLKQETKLKEDTVIGIILVSFFSFGLVLISLFPSNINLTNIVIGNLLAVSDQDILQIFIICAISLLILIVKWKDFLAIFFDEEHSASIGINVKLTKIIFFTTLSATAVASLQVVGICLIISLVITPGATAYLLTDRFQRLIQISIIHGVMTCLAGSYLSYYLNFPSGATIVLIQWVLFLICFLLAPKHGFLMRRKNVA